MLSAHCYINTLSRAPAVQDFHYIKDLLNAHPMFAIGLLLLAGYAIAKLAGRLGLPEITGYIAAGLLVSQSVSGVFPPGIHQSFKVVTEIALSLIALTIGAEFALPKIRRIAREVLFLTALQLVIVFLAVGGILVIFGMALPFALLLGIIATATEPAAAVAEVHLLKARGRFVDYLFGIVALDDATCLILFSIAVAVVARLLYGGQVGDSTTLGQVLLAVKEITLSILLGLAAGWSLHCLTRRKHGNQELLIVSLGVLFITTALAIIFHLSPLLANLAAGSLLINLAPRNHRVLRSFEPLTPPVYALFFVIAGTELDFRIMAEPELLMMGGIYVLIRAVAKYGSAYTGCRLLGMDPAIRNNLGWCMLPQGGVALGLILLLQSSPLITRVASPEVDAMLIRMLNMVLMCVLISELLGPPLMRMGILRGCETAAGNPTGKTPNMKAMSS